MLPNFLMAGSAKSGTTSVYRWLKQHPDVFFPEWKEPSYFVHNYGVSSWDDYKELFRAGHGRKVIGDASGSYLTGQESPTWIRRELGSDIKILILLRHPVERAFSLYKWMVMEGYEWFFPFERALEIEDARFHDPLFVTNSPEYFWDYMYKRSSFYTRNLTSYFAEFGADAIRVHLFDDVVGSPERVYKDVCAFLGLSDRPLPRFTRENPSIFPRSPRLQFRFRHVANRNSRLPIVSRGLNRLGHVLMDVNKAVGMEYRLPLETRAALTSIFKPDLKQLETLLGRKLPDHWYSPGG